MSSKETIVTVSKVGRNYIVKDLSGTPVTGETIPSWMLSKAVKNDMNLRKGTMKNGKTFWRQIDKDVKVVPVAVKASAPAPVLEAFHSSEAKELTEADATVQLEVPTEHEEIKKFVADSYRLKPSGLVMNELKWKYLIRSAVRGKNIQMVGPTGCGKTMAAKSVINALGRPFYYFNMGATQDPRSTLIGNTHFEKDKGTFFAQSLFVTAIQTQDAIILLDELSRAHPDAWNILMTVLDYSQRYLRLDEKENTPTIKVAKGVTFIATANVGNEYTSTKVMDRALNDRFLTIEVDVLSEEEEHNLLKYMYPSLVEDPSLKAIAGIASKTRHELRSEAPKINTMISTRMSVEMAGLLYDGFTLAEAAEVAIYPYYSPDGGNDSERVYVKQIVQKYMTTDTGEKTPDPEDKLFSDEEINAASA